MKSLYRLLKDKDIELSENSRRSRMNIKGYIYCKDNLERNQKDYLKMYGQNPVMKKGMEDRNYLKDAVRKARLSKEERDYFNGCAESVLGIRPVSKIWPIIGAGAVTGAGAGGGLTYNFAEDIMEEVLTYAPDMNLDESGIIATGAVVGLFLGGFVSQGIRKGVDGIKQNIAKRRLNYIHKTRDRLYPKTE